MLPGERPNSAFARYYSLPENISLRKAVAIAKNAPVPALVSPEPVRLVDNVSDVDQSAAYQKLEKMADELRTRLPQESPQRCFAKLFQDSGQCYFSECGAPPARADDELRISEVTEFAVRSCGCGARRESAGGT